MHIPLSILLKVVIVHKVWHILLIHIHTLNIYIHNIITFLSCVGGYSQAIVVNEGYVLKIPSNLDLAAATPLLCAGITTYSPLKEFGLKAGQKFAVVGLGGLGHMGVKFSKAFGAHTTVISRGQAKKETAIAMGADAYLDSTDEDAMKGAIGTFDFILNTVSAKHNVDQLLGLVGFDGIMVMIGGMCIYVNICA